MGTLPAKSVDFISSSRCSGRMDACFVSFIDPFRSSNPQPKADSAYQISACCHRLPAGATRDLVAWKNGPEETVSVRESKKCCVSFTTSAPADAKPRPCSPGTNPG